MKNDLNDFYIDLKRIMNKHDLVMECMDNYDGHGRWCGQTFTLRSKNPVDGRYPIYTESLSDFVDKGSD